MTVANTAARADRISRIAVEALAGLLDFSAEPILAAGVLPPMRLPASLVDIRARGKLGQDGRMAIVDDQDIVCVSPAAQPAVNERAEDAVVFAGRVSGPVTTAGVSEP
jgi:hypothetical protein